MKKAVIYGRVSTQDQDFGRQVGDMDEWAKKNGYEVVARYAEKITGASLAYGRAEFEKLLKFIEAQGVKMILVTEVSRVGRMGYKTRGEIEMLGERGINMYFHDTGSFILDKRTGQVDHDVMTMVGMRLDYAKRELVTTQNRIKSGLRNSARNGKIQSSKFKPYGFRGDDNKNIVVREDEFKVVLKIFDMFDKGATTHTITGWLNEKAIPTRYHDFKGTVIDGRKAETYTWSERTVHRVLTNRMWIGERWHKKELVHTSKPIIDVDLFERVQKKLKDRANKSNRGSSNPNYLKDIIKCECGCGMFINIDHKKRNNTYTCMSRVYAKQYKGKYCGRPSVNIDKLLNTLYSVLNEQFIKKMKGKPSTDFEGKIDLKKIQLANFEAALKKNDASQSRNYEAYIDGIDKPRYFSMKEKLERERDNLVSSVEELRNEINSLTNAKNNPIKKFYTKEMFLTEAKSIIESVTIGKSSEGDRQLIKKTEQDVGISVTVQTLTGQSFSYTLSRYSKNILFNGVVNPIANPTMTLNVKDLMSSLKPKAGIRKFKGMKAA